MSADEPGEGDSPATTFIPSLAIIGLGMIGSSLARALRMRGGVGEIRACGRDSARLAAARAAGLVDDIATDPAEAARGADVIVVATPLGSMEAQLARLALGLEPDAVLTDVGSAKGAVIDAARRALAPDALARLVPGHPIAGNERSGWEAGMADLFEGRRVILTPMAETAPDALARVRGLWRSVGAEVVEMESGRHDRLLAATSHLPHMLAYTLVDTLASMPDGEQVFEFAAGGFADFTRIAASDPRMWADICIANRRALIAALDRFTGELKELRQAIESEDDEDLMARFGQAKSARDRFGQGPVGGADE